MNKKYFIAIVVLLIIAAGIYWLLFYSPKQAAEGKVATSFEDCVAEGNPIMESYPPQCRSKAGQTFTQDVGNEIEKSDLIRLSSPRPQAIVTSPLTIKGEARGQWFFEASFPAQLVDANGKVLTQFPIQATGEWMTENFVPFTATANFTTPETATGTLILEKSNASGLPEHDDQLSIPIRFR